MSASPTPSHAAGAGPAIMRDPRLREVAWRDLEGLTKTQRARELALGLPWLLGMWLCASQGWWLGALAMSFVWFLVGLRLVHDAFHHNLGLGRRGHDAVLVILSALMCSSMHAIQFNHLRHHKHCMDDDDAEAWSARLPAYKALLYGPYFPWLLHRTAWTRGRARTRRWMLLELGLILSAATLAWRSGSHALQFHLIAMLIGQCLTAFFAVWTVHHDCDRSHFIARTVRGKLRSVMTFNMFYHVEHHLFPRVPTCRLPTLASRLDALAPELSSKRVF